MFKEKKMKIGREQNPDWGWIAEQCLITAVPKKMYLLSRFYKTKHMKLEGKIHVSFTSNLI